VIVFRIQKDHRIEVVVAVGFWLVKTAVIPLAALNTEMRKVTGVVHCQDQESHG
jgi:hypothetical protein